MTRTVLVTGTSSGIGDATARAFLDDGWNVVATARDPAAACGGIAHPRLLAARLDVTHADTIRSALDEAEQRFGAVDVVVNNAGVGLGGPLEGVSLHQLRDHLEVNVVGVVAVCQAAIARFRERKHGMIINVTSLTGRVGIPFLSPYCAGKFAVEGLTESLFYELRPFGVRVKLVEPGGARSRFSHIWAEHPAYSLTADAVKETMDRGGEIAPPASEVAKVILAAANDASQRLRYATSSSSLMLRLHRLMPEGTFRKMVSKAFGMV